MSGHVPWDNGINIENTLFVPFAEAAFPKQLDTKQLLALLDAPFTTKVPLPQSIYQSYSQLYRDLFSLEAECSAPFAAIEMVTALLAQRLRANATKIDHIVFMGNVGYHLPEGFGRRLALPICVSRLASLRLALPVHCTQSTQTKPLFLDMPVTAAQC